MFSTIAGIFIKLGYLRYSLVFIIALSILIINLCTSLLLICLTCRSGSLIRECHDTENKHNKAKKRDAQYKSGLQSSSPSTSIWISTKYKMVDSTIAQHKDR